jgi:DNA-binding transcriptional regulator YiaG
MLGICAWHVERRISLKKRVLAGCHYHMAALHSNIHPVTLIEAVRARRIALKMPLREFAVAIGRSIDSISAWENGHAVPRRSTRKRLVEWLGFDPEAFSTEAK